MNDNKIRGPSIKLSTVATSTRRTAKTDFGTVMRNGLVKGANVVSKGLQVAAPFIPGSAIVSAAVAGTNLAASFGRGGGSAGAAPASYGSAGFGVSASGLSAGGGGGIGGAGQSSGAGFIPGAHNTLQQGGGAAGAAPSDAFSAMQSKVRETAEFQASFNLQYLDLQQTIQQDTRQFNLISNIMKTKHDAAKNALNNVR
jgi:hypothetical protein